MFNPGVKHRPKYFIINIIHLFAVAYTVDGVSALTPLSTTQDSCLTGMVNIEPESGMVMYDDTHQRKCTFAQTKCYKRTIVGRAGNWPGIN